MHTAKSGVWSVRRLTFGITTAAVLLLAAAYPAHAEEPVADDEWVVLLTPYIWLPTLETTSRSTAVLPSIETETELLDVLNIAAEAAFEVRKGRVFVLADLSYVNLSAEQNLNGIVFNDAEMDVAGVLGSLNVGYRIVEEKPITFDFFAGAQIVSLDVDVSVDGPAASASASTTETLIDPIVGARFRVGLGSGFFLNAVGDVGGFNVDSKLTWQALGTVGWQANDWLAFQLGYRHLEIDFKNDGLMENMTMTGPIFGASFRL
jgi:hypothetical protein